MIRLEQLEDRLMLNAGDLDVMFAGGKATANFSSGTAQVEALAVDGNGRIVAVGLVGGTNSEIALARFNRNGALDASFGGPVTGTVPPGQTGQSLLPGEVVTSLAAGQNSAAKGVAIQPDGKIVVAGFAGASGSQEFAVVRYNADGSLDTSFGSGGSVLTGLSGNAVANGVAVTPDGKIIVAGSVEPSAFSSASDFALVRYNGNGSVDTTFGANGIVTTKLGDFDAAANSVLIEPDANTATNPSDYQIVAAGHTSTSGGDFNFALVRYNAAGSLDTTFNSTGIATTNFAQLDDVHDAILQPDGKIVAVGSTLLAGKVDLALARYNSDGSLDTTFGDPIKGTDPQNPKGQSPLSGKLTTDLGGTNQSANSVVLQSDGKLVVAGVYAPNGPSQFFLARYTAAGALDSTFGANGVTFTAFDPTANAGAAGLVQLPDGTFAAGGSAGTSFGLARYWGDNSPPSYAEGSANAVYVNTLYEQLLGRPADQPGLSGWVNLLDRLEKGTGTFSGVPEKVPVPFSRAQIAAGIEGSPEYLTRLVDGLYSTLLNRSADPGGEAGFVAALAAGMTIEQVKATMLGSPEYFQTHGRDNTTFLQALYLAVLSRPIDPLGQSAWLGALGHLDRSTIAGLILTSPEAQQDLVQSAYQQYLHRPADPSGLSGWLTNLQHGMTDQTLAAAFLGSAEYFNRM